MSPLSAQEKGRVFVYDVNYNLGRALTKKGFVFTYQDQVFYSTTKSVFLNNIKQVKSSEKGGYEINFMIGNVSYENIIVSAKQRRLEELNFISDDVFVTQETLIKQDWHPTGKQKTISGRSCLELTTEFRGRTYLAYVDLSIPFSYGPWKFNSLPGLPILVKDTAGKLRWVLQKILPIDTAIIAEKANTLRARFSELDKKPLREYVRLYDQTNGGTRHVYSKLPRNYKPSSPQHYKRGGLELIYEWEEKDSLEKN